MLKEILETCAKKPYLSKKEQEEFFAKLEASKDKVLEKIIASAIGINPDTFSRHKKQNKILRVLSYLLDSTDKAQKYDEIKKI